MNFCFSKEKAPKSAFPPRSSVSEIAPLARPPSSAVTFKTGSRLRTNQPWVFPLDSPFNLCIGVEYFRKEILLADQRILLEIWDTAGQERYRSLVKFFYKNAKGALIVFDLCDRRTFQNVDFWLRSLRVNSDRDVVVFVLGNKCDKPENRQVSNEEISGFCEANELEYFETSAKEGTLIEEVFLGLGSKINEKFKYSESFQNNSMSSEIEDLRREKGCTVCEC